MAAVQQQAEKGQQEHKTPTQQAISNVRHVLLRRRTGSLSELAEDKDNFERIMRRIALNVAQGAHRLPKIAKEEHMKVGSVTNLSTMYQEHIRDSK
ncbi:MAG: hypothetical protein KGH60_04090 [Candidatus Micrarchaeota archaeon]|nr:hypothetical protein [Candidatus Micrarchaeota archaeon]